MDVFCGIDWAEDHHDVALVDRDGALLARRRIGDDAAGFAAAAGPARRPRRQRRGPDPGGDRDPARAAGRLPARHRPAGVPDQPDGRGPLPGPALGRRPQVRPRRRRRAGEHPAHRRARAPAAAGRHRARPGHRGAGPRPAGRRLGPHHRAQQAPLPPARVLPRLPGRVRQRQRGGILRPEARVILAAAPDPGRGRQAHPDPAARAAAQGRPQPRHRRRGRPAARRVPRSRRCASCPSSSRPWAARPWPCSRQLDAACATADDLEQAVIESFNQHPDAEIITSFPGLGALTGARVLAEIGDDRSRFADAKALKAYAGAAPVTRASGKTTAVLHRRVKNQRLAAAGYIWAFSALTASPGARAHYDRRRERRRPARRRPAQPVQPPARLPPPLPGHRPALRRAHRLPASPPQPGSLTQIAPRLTTKPHRMSISSPPMSREPPGKTSS